MAEQDDAKRKEDVARAYLQATLDGTLIVLMVGLLAVGCGNSDSTTKQPRPLDVLAAKVEAEAKAKKEEEQRRQKEEAKKVVGSYKAIPSLRHSIIFLHENGVIEEIFAGDETSYKTDSWMMVGKEVHLPMRSTISNFMKSSTGVFKIEPNGDLTLIASIDRDGKRSDWLDAAGHWKVVAYKKIQVDTAAWKTPPIGKTIKWKAAQIEKIYQGKPRATILKVFGPPVNLVGELERVWFYE